MSKTRVINFTDIGAKHDRMHLLSSQQLFSVMAVGLMPIPALEEILKRSKEFPGFLVEMFEFGDSLPDNAGNKFKEWFCSPLSGLGELNAQIISEIASSETFSRRAKDFLPDNFRNRLQSSTLEKRYELLIPYMNHIEKPEVVFSDAKSGLFNPVILTLQHLGESPKKNDAIQVLRDYLERHAHKELGKQNRFGPASEYREAFEGIVSAFTNDERITSCSNIIEILSVFSGDTISLPKVGQPSIREILDNKQFSDVFATKVVKIIVAEKNLTIADVARDVDCIRSLDIFSSSFPRKELIKRSSRFVRGQALSDDLGM